MKKSCLYKRIVFDLDGTLYDIHDVIESAYILQRDFLSKKLGLDVYSAEALLNENHIYSEMRPDSRSATEFFGEIGISTIEWKEYRETHYDVNLIQLSHAVSNDVIRSFSELAELALVSSNTQRIIRKTLSHIKIDYSTFSIIIGSDSSAFSEGFSKQKVFKDLIRELPEGEKILSVGDRYLTDIEPMLLLGGDGVLINSPQALTHLLSDLCSGEMTQNGYFFYDNASSF